MSASRVPSGGKPHSSSAALRRRSFLSTTSASFSTDANRIRVTRWSLQADRAALLGARAISQSLAIPVALAHKIAALGLTLNPFRGYQAD